MKENRRLALEINRIGRQALDERNRADRMKEYEKQNTSLREEINELGCAHPGLKAKGHDDWDRQPRRVSLQPHVVVIGTATNSTDLYGCPPTVVHGRHQHTANVFSDAVSVIFRTQSNEDLTSRSPSANFEYLLEQATE